MTDITLINDAGALDLSLPTAADLSALQYHFVKLNTSEKVVACGANEKPLGILQNDPDGSTNEATAIVRVQGNSKLSIAETVAFGNFLTSTAASKGEVADAAGEEYGAKVITSGESGDLVSVLVVHGEVEASDA